jgi:hypothetical protein
MVPSTRSPVGSTSLQEETNEEHCQGQVSEEDELEYSSYEDTTTGAEDDVFAPDAAQVNAILATRALNVGVSDCYLCGISDCEGGQILKDMGITWKPTGRPTTFPCTTFQFFWIEDSLNVASVDTKCYLCQFSSKDRPGMLGHLLDSHGIIAIPFELITKTSRYLCMICKQYISPDAARIHQENHSPSTKCVPQNGEFIIYDPAIDLQLPGSQEMSMRVSLVSLPPTRMLINTLDNVDSLKVPLSPRTLHCGICGKECNGSIQYADLGLFVHIHARTSTDIKISPYNCQALTFAVMKNDYGICGLNLSCLLCVWEGEKLNDLRNHLREKHDLTPISYKNLLHEHKYFCRICREFYGKESFDAHVRRHEEKMHRVQLIHEPKRTILEAIPKSFLERTPTLQHIHKISSVESFSGIDEMLDKLRCFDCSISFPDLEGFKLHMHDFHHVDLSFLNSLPPPVCQLCGLEVDPTTVHMEGFHRLQTHSAESFLGSFHSETHLDGHCLVCDTYFANHNLLFCHLLEYHHLQLSTLFSIHQRTQSTSKKRKCLYCAKEYALFYDVEKHYKGYHRLEASLSPEFIFSSEKECHSCVKQFASHSVYLSHLMAHHHIHPTITLQQL